ncbi:MAG: hypothetical protein IPG76_18560 [Acidobacteria bacterium]|nr:hypothetical protein [Acidobacteriota bacterium]
MEFRLMEFQEFRLQAEYSFVREVPPEGGTPCWNSMKAELHADSLTLAFY